MSRSFNDMGGRSFSRWSADGAFHALRPAKLSAICSKIDRDSSPTVSSSSPTKSRRFQQGWSSHGSGPHLAALRANGDPVPRPRTWADLSDEWVRINITIDKGLLSVADEAAEAEGINR
ncbi:hypothetical protein, partial [Methylorubrum sp. POS3]|uniref:hypothetical protein n=1 Tax=Methylorubrum sp. POS3 TaxID=2998492 RepID=UPI00372BEF23